MLTMHWLYPPLNKDQNTKRVTVAVTRQYCYNDMFMYVDELRSVCLACVNIFENKGRVDTTPQKFEKRSCISTVGPTVHTNPRTFLKPEKFADAVFSSLCGRKYFGYRAFRKRWRRDNHMTSLTEFSSNRNFK